MDHDLVGALKRATAQTRAGDLMEATRTIQAALGRKAASEPAEMRVVNPEPAPALRKRFPLREVVATLTKARAARPKPVAPTAPAETAEGTFLLRHHAGTSGKRDYRLFLPAGAAPKGLIVMLHGCTQTAADFAAGTGMNRVAAGHGLAVAYPEQTSSHNSAACWNWFQPGDQGRGRGEPAILAELTQNLMAEYGLSRDRVFVAGLSAGGAMAAVMAEAYPEIFAAAGVHSGLAVGAATDVMGAFSAMQRGAPAKRQAKTRTIIFHGAADATVHPANAAEIVAAHGPAKAHTDKGLAPGGRRYSRTVHTTPDGTPKVELWLIDGAGHAWSGGHASGSYTDPAGPDASAAMVRFFLSGSGAE